MLQLFVALAVAFDPTATARVSLEANPTGAVAVTCARYDAAAPALGAVLGLGAVGPITGVFARPADAAARGVDVKAPVTVVFEKGPLFVQLGFAGTPEQADAFVRGLDADAIGGGTHWTFKEGGAVDLRDGNLILARPPAGQPVGARHFAAHELPAVEGCAVVVDARSKNKPVQALAMVPYVGQGPSAAFFDFEKPLPAALTRTNAEIPMGVLVDGPPDMVMTLSAPLDEVIAAFPEKAPVAGVLTSDDLARVKANASFPAGVTLIMKGNPKTTGQWALMTRVVDLDGDPFPRARLVKALVKALADKDAKRIDKSSLSFQQKDKTTYVVLGDQGAVVLSSSLELAKTSVGDVGLPWLSPDDVMLARQAPIALRVAMKGETALWLTAAGVDKTLEVRSQLTLGPTERAGLMAAGAMMAPMMQYAMQAQLEKAKAAAAAPAPQ